MQAAMPIVGLERIVYYREQAVSAYNTWAYGVVLAIVELRECPGGGQDLKALICHRAHADGLPAWAACCQALHALCSACLHRLLQLAAESTQAAGVHAVPAVRAAQRTSSRSAACLLAFCTACWVRACFLKNGF
jgi:hypothetical protein